MGEVGAQVEMCHREERDEKLERKDRSVLSSGLGQIDL